MPDAATELLLRYARAGHDAGYPTADLEERVLALARAFGIVDIEVSATPTLVEVSLGSLPRQRAYTLRVRPTEVDLDAIARLDELVQGAVEGRLDEDGASSAWLGLQLGAALLAALAFTITLRARSGDALVMGAAACLAVAPNEVGARLFGNEAAVFVAALAVGVTGGLVGSWLRGSPLVFVVPGVLMLVPGSAGFNSVVQLLADQTVSGITAGFDTFVTAMAIAYGLMVSTALLPRSPHAEPTAPR